MNHPSLRGRRGFSLIDILITVAVLSISTLGFLGVTISSKSFSRETRQLMAASNLARQMVEQMHLLGGGLVFATFNSDPADDPAGVGTAPGPVMNLNQFRANFGLSTTHQVDREQQLEGLQFSVALPLSGGQIRENLVDPGLGLPRDLNGDNAVDGADHSADFMVLPLSIRVQWTAPEGVRQITWQTMVPR